MAIPKFYETFLPILKVLENGNEFKTADLPQKMLDAGYFIFSEADHAEKTKSGVGRFYDRVYWGTTYLKQGKFVERPSRGMIRITQKGLDFLKKNPTQMSLKWLQKDTDFIAYVPDRLKIQHKSELIETQDLSPDDLLEQGFSELEAALQRDLLEKLSESNPYYFEKIVLILFKKMGYGDFEETSKSRDGGIDGIINQDQLGIEKIYIQAKRYAIENKVREPEVRNFIGAMSGDVSKGIFVTTSFFDAAAIKKASDARNHRIILIDGSQLVSLMIKYNVGVQIKTVYEVKEIDEDFFEIG